MRIRHRLFTASAAALFAFTVFSTRVHAQAPQYAVTVLGSLGNPPVADSAYAVNASGQVAGFSVTSSGALDAVVWNGTTPTVLTSVGGTTSQANGINASGQVVGVSDTLGNAAKDAVEWNGTTPTNLGNLGGSGGSVAYSINDSGQVVGNSSTTGNASYDGFLYTGGTMYDLNNIIEPGSGVTDIEFLEYGSSDVINDNGQIVASGTYEGNTVGVLLTPTPEPASAALLALGAGALLARRHRRNA